MSSNFLASWYFSQNIKRFVSDMFKNVLIAIKKEKCMNNEVCNIQEIKTLKILKYYFVLFCFFGNNNYIIVLYV